MPFGQGLWHYHGVADWDLELQRCFAQTGGVGR